MARTSIYTSILEGDGLKVQNAKSDLRITNERVQSPSIPFQIVPDTSPTVN